MAFQTIDQWQVERSFGLPNGSVSFPSLSENLPYRDRLQKISSGIFSISLNGLILYFLITATFDKAFEQEPVQTSGEITSMTFLNLGETVEEEPSKNLASGEREAPRELRATAPSELEASVETPLPPEWSRARIRVPRLVSNNIVSEPRTNSGTGQGEASGGDQDGGIYDPFAGAAPNRKPESDRALPKAEREISLAGRISGAFGFGEAAKAEKQSVFETWVAGLRKRLPRARGTIELSVQTAPDGKVKSSEILGGSASPQVKFFVRNAAIGQRLSGMDPDPAGSVKLPVIRLN